MADKSSSLWGRRENYFKKEFLARSIFNECLCLERKLILLNRLNENKSSYLRKFP